MRSAGKLKILKLRLRSNFAYYNFCKRHITIRCTPAMEAGVEKKKVNGRLRNWLNAVANKSDYLARLQVAVQQLHNCGATWRESVHVREVFRGETLLDGEIEVFDLTGHPKARRCYGWSHPDGLDNKTERFVTVLEIPPVVRRKQR